MKRFNLAVALGFMVIGLCISGGSYCRADAAEYELGAIPDQTAWRESDLIFDLTWQDGTGAYFSVQCQPEPAGDITLEEISSGQWQFQYLPDPLDTMPFTVTILGESGDETLSQSFVITPLRELPLEADVFDTGHTQPFTSTADIDVLVDTDDDRIRITGLIVEIKEGLENRLFENYFDGTRTDLSQIEIIADQVIFKSPCRLKGTDTIIHARKLIFTENGRLTTTPARKHPGAGIQERRRRWASRRKC